MLSLFGDQLTNDYLLAADRMTYRLLGRTMTKELPGQFRPLAQERPLAKSWRERCAPGVPEKALQGVVMEIGCGIGQQVVAGGFARCQQYIGVDASRLAVALAKGRFEDWPNVHIGHVADDLDGLEAEINRCGGIEVAFGVSMFIHLTAARMELILARLLTLLKPGGYVSVDVLLDEAQAEEPPGTGPHAPYGRVYRRAPEEVEELLQRLGYRDVQSESVNEVRAYVSGRSPSA